MSYELNPVVDTGLIATNRYTLDCRAEGKVAAVEFFNQGTTNVKIMYAGVTRLLIPGAWWTASAPTLAYLVTEYNVEFIPPTGGTNNLAISIQKYVSNGQ